MSDKFTKINKIIKYLAENNYILQDNELKKMNDTEVNIVYDIYINNIINIQDIEISSDIMVHLARHYCIIHNYDLMKKYYLMAIEKGNQCAMNNLSVYYFLVEKNNDLAKKYLLMAIETGVINAMINLALIYKTENNYDMAIKYYIMALENGDNESFYNIILLDKNFALNYISNMIKMKQEQQNKIKELENKVEELNNKIIELEFKPGGIGYQKTRNDFYEKVNKHNHQY